MDGIRLKVLESSSAALPAAALVVRFLPTSLSSLPFRTAPYPLPRTPQCAWPLGKETRGNHGPAPSTGGAALGHSGGGTPSSADPRGQSLCGPRQPRPGPVGSQQISEGEAPHRLSRGPHGSKAGPYAPPSLLSIPCERLKLKLMAGRGA